ncbi:MAG TPA: hypothetical protein VFM18_20175, partial [Methanosarcina sp.]|nr:hypothetical protein [Methanosarcina sp.]
GTGYDTVRNSGQVVSLPQNWLSSTLKKYGLNYDNGVVSANRLSKTRNTTDINRIQEFVNNWGNSHTFSAQEYLNMRHDLSELAKYDVTGAKSNVPIQFAQDLREGVLNSDAVRNQLDGLKSLDTKYAADKTFYKQIERDLINPQTGGLKDGATSKIINSVTAANPERLARLEKLYPGFTQQAKAIKAIEDVESAMGLKVGSYARAGLVTGQVFTGNIPAAIVTAILTQPEVAVPLLKGYGYTAKTIAPVLKSIHSIASDINNFRFPGGIAAYMQEKYPDGVPVGLSIKKSITPASVAKRIDKQDFSLITKFIDDPQGSMLNDKIMRLLDEIGIGKADQTTQVRFLKDIVDEASTRGF